MKLTLTYSGPLPPKKSRGISPVKAALRASFHRQIKEQVERYIQPSDWDRASSIIGGHRFVSPAHSGLHTAVELDVLLLTPAQNRVVGDADNRLKTLIDGLTRPANVQQLNNFVPPSDGGPTYCLLDDDSLVQGVALDSRRWHEPSADSGDAFVVVTARIVLGDSADLSAPMVSLFLLV